jgi:hypothetical protein
VNGSNDDELAGEAKAALSQNCRRFPPVAAFGALLRNSRRGPSGVGAI